MDRVSSQSLAIHNMMANCSSDLTNAKFECY